MLVLHNARIYSPDTAELHTATAIHDGRILAVGTDEAILGEYGLKARRQDMHGSHLLPGLIDAHIHLENYALALLKVDCETSTRAECLQRVTERSRIVPERQWITGHGWNHNAWPEGMGNAAWLDAASRDHPAYLTAKSLHAAWVNSAALQAAGIHPETPDPLGGVIQRDDEGQPTGILFESAMQLVERMIPPTNPAIFREALLHAQEKLLHYGLTCVHDFDGSACFATLQSLHQAGQLKLRVVKAIHEEDLIHALEIGLHRGFGDDRLRLGPLKLFADGALGPQTAAMLEPYEGSQDSQGILLLGEDEIYEFGQRASTGGYNLAVHAIGDHANRVALNAIAKLREFERKNHLPALRHRIEHVQLISPSDQPRLAELQATASMQPIHAPSDSLMADRYWGARSQHAYAWQSLRQQHAHLAFGSDAPVESPDPFWGLHAAVTRCRQDGSPGKDGWYPQQRLNLADAIHGFTLGAAYAASMEDCLGKLAPGFMADIIMLEDDLFQLPEGNLYQVKPAATMVAGEWV
jgi:predicted amidohydrolase YtcJ